MILHWISYYIHIYIHTSVELSIHVYGYTLYVMYSMYRYIFLGIGRCWEIDKPEKNHSNMNKWTTTTKLHYSRKVCQSLATCAYFGPCWELSRLVLPYVFWTLHHLALLFAVRSFWGSWCASRNPFCGVWVILLGTGCLDEVLWGVMVVKFLVKVVKMAACHRAPAICKCLHFQKWFCVQSWSFFQHTTSSGWQVSCVIYQTSV